MDSLQTISLSWKTGSSSGSAQSAHPHEPFEIPVQLGPVRLIRQLGQGGMGVVWLGHHEFLDREVAVKFLLGAVSDEGDPHYQSFLDGARAAARVRHLGLTAVLHADVVGRIPYLVMEYVAGPSLAEVLSRAGGLRVEAACAALAAAADAIDALHAEGLAHRDIKPHNLLVDADGRVHLTDFGLSCRVDAPGGPGEARVVGTPPYMGPEAFDGRCTTKSDVYALGVTAYHLLVGRTPFSGSFADLERRHRVEPLPVEPLREVGAPDALIQSIIDATNKDPLFRVRSAAKFAERVREVLDARPGGVRAGMRQLAELAASIGRTCEAQLANHPASFPIRAPSTTGAPITVPIACIKCQYDLRGLGRAGKCPECQTPVESSLDPSRLIFADSAWMARVGRGLWMLAAAMGAIVVLSFPIMAGAQFAGDGRRGWVMSIAVIVLLSSPPTAIGLWWAGEPESSSAGRKRYRPPPRMVSVGVLAIAAILELVALSLTLARSGATTPGAALAGALGLLAWGFSCAILVAANAWAAAKALHRIPRTRHRWISDIGSAVMAVASGLCVFAAVLMLVASLRGHGEPLAKIIDRRLFAVFVVLVPPVAIPALIGIAWCWRRARGLCVARP